MRRARNRYPVLDIFLKDESLGNFFDFSKVDEKQDIEHALVFGKKTVIWWFSTTKTASQTRMFKSKLAGIGVGPELFREAPLFRTALA